MDLLHHISTVPLFQGLSREHLEHMAVAALEQVFKKGQIIFSEGEDGSGFYLVLRGRVKVFKLSPEGKEQILHILGPGEPVGEVAVLSGELFPANAQAMEESRLLFFPREVFVEMIRRDPSVALRMLGVLAKRLRKFTMLIEDLSLKEVPGRLASYLLEQERPTDGKAGSFTLDIPKAQLASLLGTIPETLSRILARMAGEELIQLNGTRGIRILDREGLEELAQGLRRLS